MSDDGTPVHEPPKRPPSKRRPRWRAQLTEIDWYSDKLVQIEEMLELLTTAPTDDAGNLIPGWRPNGNPIAALMLRAADFRTKLDRLLSGRPNLLEGMDPAEVREYLQPVLEEWPDQVLELALQVYGERHRGRFLFVAESGHRAEYDPAEGWVSEEEE